MVTVDDAVLDIIAGSLLLAVQRVVDQKPGSGYAVGVITQLLRSLGVAVKDATCVASAAVNAAMTND